MQPKTHPPIRAGALTLLLTLVAICLSVLSVLSVLSFSTALADLRLAEKSMSRFQQDAALENEGQRWLAALDGQLTTGADGSTVGELLPDGTVQTILKTSDGRSLTIAVRPTPDADPGYTVVRWQFGQDWTPETDLNLWDGSF